MNQKTRVVYTTAFVFRRFYNDYSERKDLIMKIRFGSVEIDFSDKQRKEETFAERTRREHQEFLDDFDRRSDQFHARMRNR